MTTKWIILAVVLAVLGISLFIVVMGVSDWDLSRLGSTQFETNTYQFSDAIQNIRVSTDTAGITFLPSEDEICRVICHEYTKAQHRTAITDGTLSVEVSNTRKWYDYITIFNFNTPRITIYLPLGTYEDLFIEYSTGTVRLPEEFRFESISISGSTGKVDCRASVTGQIQIRNSTGGIHLESLTAGQVDLAVSTGTVFLSSVTCKGDISLRVSTGKATLSDIACRDLISEGDTGDLLLSNVIASGKFVLARDTGDIRFDRCDASELSVKTDTGDVTGSLLSGKVFLAHTDTGRVKVPQTVTGGKCEIRTDTGDIIITIQ